MAKKQEGLYANINAKRERIAEGSGEKMRRVGSKGAPTVSDFKESAKTAKMKSGGKMSKSCW
jgi:signal recognition particle GTPase